VVITKTSCYSKTRVAKTRLMVVVIAVEVVAVVAAAVAAREVLGVRKKVVLMKRLHKINLLMAKVHLQRSLGLILQALFKTLNLF